VHGEYSWGLLIVIYLFFGGLSAGAMMLSAAAMLFGRADRHAAIVRNGAILAPLPVILGTALLVFDLGRPFFFWKLFFAIKPLSPMWIGSWLLALFSLVTLAYAYLHLPITWQRWPVPHAESWRRRLAISGLPLGFAVAVYTAVLLGVLVARPLWNTPVLAVLFVLSALSSAAAALMLVVPAREHGVLSTADIILLASEGLALAGLLFFGAVSSSSARHGVSVLAAGDYALTFWLGVVLMGLLVPAALEVRAARVPHGSRALAALAAWLVLAGGVLLRYVVVFAGQQSALLAGL
jgi:formate-dependent nitrite reductase membrane component NrfD